MSYLDELNEAQREAVLDREHNLLILACAGSGKTRTITSKIAYYIESGFLKPWEILAVTFTNKAAEEMRQRLRVMLSGYDISSLEIRTFHAFGAWVLRRHSREAGLPSGFQIYDDTDSVSLLSSVFPDLEKREVRNIYNAIAQAKERGIGPDSGKLEYFAKDIDDLGLYYQDYERALRATGNCDFSDLILKPVILFNRYDEIRMRYQKRFRLILVDEYQDSNRMQFELLSLVSSKTSQLCVVGDDDQSIYSFRGADIENILSFNKAFKNVREIKLEKNYRSTSEILSLAASVIRNNKERHKKDIISFDGHHGKKPELISSMDASSEADSIVSRIRHIDDYDNTAVIYRTNAQSLEFEKALTKSRIPYRVVGALKFYEREEVKDALAILRILSNRMDVINFRRIINKPSRALGEKTVDQILSGRSTVDVISALASFALTAKAKAKAGAETFLSAYEKSSEDLDAGVPLGALLTEALDNFGLKGYYESEKDESVRMSRSENLNALIGSLDEYGSGRSQLEAYLENITLDNTTPGGTGKDERKGVTLITMHNTKGLEFDYVFVAGLEDELIPGSRSSQSAKGLEEERRLFYVAVTRARKELYLSYAAVRFMWGRRDYRNPSRYLDEIPKELYSGAVYKSSYNPYSFIGAKIDHKKEGDAIENRPSWASKIEIKAVKKNPEKKEIPLFSLRDEVKSPIYGKGVILDIKEGEVGHRLLTIDFEALGKVRLNEGTSDLTLLSSSALRPASTSGFEKGDKVRSPAYGEGVVEDISEINGKRVLSVLFSSSKRIKLMEGYSKLEKIEQ